MPADKLDALYERVIEIQERQQAFNDELLRAGVRRDELVEKTVEILASRNPVFQQLVENTDVSLRHAAVRDLKNHIDGKDVAARDYVERKSKAIIWWLFASTFLGALLGNGAGPIVDALLKLRP